MARSFDPFGEMDRLFSDITRTPAAAAMPMDLYRAADEFVAEIDLPGVDPSSIDIDMEERTVTIRAQRRTHGDSAEGTQWLTRERPSGTFARQLTLGYGVEPGKIAAEYRDGVLVLHIPVAEASKPRKIEVQHASHAQQIEGEVSTDNTNSDGATGENAS